MSYDADFAGAGPVGAPLDPIVMIGAEPMFWAALLLALLAALLLGWYLGARSDAGRTDAAHAIWKAVQDAARAAMGADDNALKGRAEALRKVVEERLGKTLKFAGGLSRQIKTLDEAIAGRGPAHPSGGHGALHSSGHGPAGVAGGPAPAPAPAAGGGGGAATANITIVTGAAPEPAHAAVGHGPVHDPKATRDLTQREQTDALRLAVAAFNEHWRDEAARVRELREAHAELSNPGAPSRAARPVDGKVHGTRATH